MTAGTTSPHVRLAVVVVLTLATVAALGSPSTAGGWAIASLDSIPTAETGKTTDVPFTILQHGTTPADLDDDVGIQIIDRDGGSSFFPAISDGTVGHYVATVTFPEVAGTYEWRVRMGWFGHHDLGTLDVRSADPSPVGAWERVRWRTLAGGLLLAGFATWGVILARRRRLAIG